MILRLTRLQLQLLKKAAKKVYPVECCALLFGEMSMKEAVVRRIVVTPNILQSAMRFEIDPTTFVDALAQAELDGLTFVGFFHSHPAPARPSAVDVRFMRLWSDAIWLVLSLTDDDLAAFQMIEGKVNRVPLALIDALENLKNRNGRDSCDHQQGVAI